MTAVQADWAGRRVRSPSPSLPLLDPRCAGDDPLCLEGAGFEELLRTFGAGLEAPAVTPPAFAPACPSPPATLPGELALVLAAAPQPSAALSPEAAGPRCLDATHACSAACACTPAPPEGEEAQYELLSNVSGKKNGEKRLRSQLSRTPEWRSMAERERLARACDAAGPGRAALARALRVGHCSLLRKSDLLYLARAWGYRSDIWGLRKERRVRGPLPEATSFSAVVPHGAAAANAQPVLERIASVRPEDQASC